MRPILIIAGLLPSQSLTLFARIGPARISDFPFWVEKIDAKKFLGGGGPITGSMEPSVIIAVVSALSSVIAAALSYYFSRKRERESEWRNQKLINYRELLSALSDAAIHGINNDKAQERFANSFNTIVLVAPQSVLRLLLEFHDEISVANPSPSKQRHDELLSRLVLEIRKDLEIKPADDFESFNFRLIGKRPERR